MLSEELSQLAHQAPLVDSSVTSPIVSAVDVGRCGMVDWDIDTAKIWIMTELASIEAANPTGPGVAVSRNNMGQDDSSWHIASRAIEALITERMARGKPAHTFKTMQEGQPPPGFERLRLTKAGLALVSSIEFPS